MSEQTHSFAEEKLCCHAKESILKNIQQKDIVGRKGKNK